MTRSTRAVVCLLALVALATSCGDTSGPRVPASIILTPNQPVIGQGLKLQLSATVVDAAGHALRGEQVTFSSSAPAVVAISPTGLMTSQGPLGTVLITADDHGISDTVRVRIRQRVVALSVTPNPLALHRNTEARLTVIATDVVGNPVPNAGQFNFTSDSPSIASVGIVGQVMAPGPTGSATITVEIDGIVVNVPVTVYLVATSVRATPSTVAVKQGGSKQLVTEVLDSLGTPIAGRSVTYVNHDPSLFSVSPSGLVTSIAGAGSGSLNAKSGSLTQLVPVLIVTGLVGTISATTPIGEPAYGVAIGPGGELFVGLLNSGSVVRGSLPGYNLGPPQHVGDLPLGMAINPAGTRTYIALGYGQAVAAIDITTNQPLPSTIGLGNDVFSVAVSPDNQTLFVGAELQIYFVDASTMAIIDSVPAIIANHLAVHPVQPLLYASMTGSDKVVEVSTSTHQVVRSFQVGGTPQGVGLSQTGDRLYIANENARLQVWNLTTGLEIDSVALNSGGFGLGVTSDALIVTEPNGGIEIFDRATLIRRALIPSGGSPRRVGVNSAGTVAAVANEGGWVDFIE